MKLKEEGPDRVTGYGTNTQASCSSVGVAPTNPRTTTTIERHLLHLSNQNCFLLYGPSLLVPVPVTFRSTNPIGHTRNFTADEASKEGL